MAPGDAFRVSVGLWLEQDAQGGGILFDVQRPTSHLGSQLVRLGRDELGTYVLCGYFDANNVLQVQANERVTGQPDLSEVGHLSILVGPRTYSVLVGDQPVLRDLPRMASGGWVGLDAQGGPVVFSDAQVDLIGENATVAEPAEVVNVAPAAQPTPPPTMRLPYQADFRTALDQTVWQPLAGQWAIDNGALVQQRSDESDDGVTLEDAPGGDYTIRTRFHHMQGMGGGVIFDLPSRTSRNGGQIVRYADEAGGVFWGYLDQQGTWRGQGSMHTEPAGTTSHALEVGIRRDSYSIRLDGQALAVGVPRVNRAGYIGLTTSHSVVAYESFEVLPSADLATRLGTGPLPGARILSGDWSADDTSIQQHSNTPTDLLLDRSLGRAAVSARRDG